MDLLNQSLRESLKTLTEEGIILYPTDTIWGLGCDATHADAIQKIYQIKKRGEEKSLIILVSKMNMIFDYVQKPSEKLIRFLENAITPTTAIFSNAKNLPSNLTNANGTIAIRVVRDVFCQRLIEGLGKPIVSTSANTAGEAPPKSFADVSKEMRDQVDFVVAYRQDDHSEKAPSSIIRLNEKGEVEKVR